MWKDQLEYTKNNRLGLINDEKDPENEEDVDSSQDALDGPSRNSKTIHKKKGFEITRGKRRSNNPIDTSEEEEDDDPRR